MVKTTEENGHHTAPAVFNLDGKDMPESLGITEEQGKALVLKYNHLMLDAAHEAGIEEGDRHRRVLVIKVLTENFNPFECAILGDQYMMTTVHCNVERALHSKGGDPMDLVRALSQHVKDHH